MDEMESMIGEMVEMKFLEVNEEEERCVFSARNAVAANMTANFQVRETSWATSMHRSMPASVDHTQARTQLDLLTRLQTHSLSRQTTNAMSSCCIGRV